MEILFLLLSLQRSSILETWPGVRVGVASSMKQQLSSPIVRFLGDGSGGCEVLAGKDGWGKSERDGRRDRGRGEGWGGGGGEEERDGKVVENNRILISRAENIQRSQLRH